jgi:FKBP-type peptidyl-prolyl cis-trans isomerase FklB
MSEKKLNTQAEQFSYAIGLSVASNLIGSNVKSIDTNAFNLAIEDAYKGNMPQIDSDEANKIIQEFFERTKNDELTKNIKEGENFLAENKKKEGIQELPSGMQFEIINQGDGELPTINDQVECHYHGTLINGNVFDSSVERKQTATFPVNGVIKGWQEALQLMSVGSKWRLFIPSQLAYGEQGAGADIGPNSTLIFEVELISIVK